MAFNQALAGRVRDLLKQLPGYAEREMFGGIGFMLHGNMACGVIGDDLIVRVGPEAYEGSLTEPHTGVFDMTGRPMKGWVVVKLPGVATEDALDGWVQRGVSFATSLPAK